MKILIRWSKRERVVATFGQARLVEKQRGTYELRGGTNSDQAEAKEWISLFCHEALVGPQSGSDPERNRMGI